MRRTLRFTPWSARVLLPKTLLHGLAGRSRRARRTSRTPSGAGTSTNECCVRSTRTNPGPVEPASNRAARIGDSNDPATFTLPELSSVKRCVPAIQGKFFTSPDAEGATLMSKGREIHCYDYVKHPYEQVRDALSRDAPAVFQSATKAAASRAQSIASELRIDIGGIGIEADIRVSIKNVEVEAREAWLGPATRLQLEWEAARMPRLF